MTPNPEEKKIGRDNYYSAVTAYEKIHRRDFLTRTVAGGAAIGAGVGAMYFGYGKPSRPIRIAVIGTGDEGSVLIGALNPDYVEVKAICDCRPSSQFRAFHGDWSTANTIGVRPGLLKVFGWKSEEEARRHVKVYTDYMDVMKDSEIEGVIIATPLFLHAPMSVAAMLSGKHVLCEKLMAHNVAECKWMTRVAKATNKFLSIGHQRHYNILYDNAVNMIRWGLLGEIHHIRAQWHRGNLPGKDSWELPIPGGDVHSNGKRIDEIVTTLNKFRSALKTSTGSEAAFLKMQVAQWSALDEDKFVDAKRYGYLDDPSILGSGKLRTAMEELVRWRLWDRTAGGLMAELGSHQIDAASIFIAALSKDVGKKVHPLTVHAVGGRQIFPKSRDADDHVYCTFEFPGQGFDFDKVGFYDPMNSYPPKTGVPSYEDDPNKKVVVTYSSINGNGYGGYGEIVMGTKGTLVLDKELEAMLYQAGPTYVAAGVKKDGGTGILDTSASGDPALAKAAEGAKVSRGYQEEIEHWAWCISQGDLSNQPRCDGSVGLADAVIALVSRQAIQNSNKPKGHGFVQFDDKWFDFKSDEVPEPNIGGSANTDMESVRKRLGIPDSLGSA
jgi:predicted dehydrogenase